MTILSFDGEDETYWWIFCFEKIFKEHGTLGSLKVLKAVRGALQGCALEWWLWLSRHHPSMSWNTFTTVLIWRFKPEWSHLFQYLDEEMEPYESIEFLDNNFRDPILSTVDEKFSFPEDFVANPVLVISDQRVFKA
ncbi:unnamed protein product [Lathyrus oleraceus]